MKKNLILMTNFMNLKSIHDKIKELHGEEEAKHYYGYLASINSDPKQKWVNSKDDSFFITKYNEVKREGLILDGKHITLQSTGLSFDYVAYKNKMLLVYPDSKIDINLVYEGDTFEFKKEGGKINYTHEFTDPFSQTDEKIQGGYCIIKNKRGEFITLLSKDDFQKHRKVAKTDFIWKSWYKEMCLKTLFKKAIKIHFDDIYEKIEEEDNTQYDLEKLAPSIEEKKSEVENKYKDL